MKSLVNKIAGRLSGINRDDLSTAEKHIVALLLKSGHLEEIGEGDFIDQDHSDFKGDPETMIPSKYVRSIAVSDVDTGRDVMVEIRKMESGYMVGFDDSFLDQLMLGENPYSPYDEHAIVDSDNEIVDEYSGGIGNSG